MANVIYAKFGKSILFDESKWSPAGGDNEASYLLFAMARFYPEHTFWIVGKSDWDRVFPEGHEKFPNIKYIWSKEYWEDATNPNKYSDDEDKNVVIEKYCNYTYKTFQRLGITIDYGILLMGIMYNAHIPNCVPKTRGVKDTDPIEFCKPLECPLKYSSHINVLLNETDVPWMIICTDPRQTRNKPKDLINQAYIVASQIDDVYSKAGTKHWYNGKHVPTLNDRHHESSYAEFINLLSRDPYMELKNLDRDWFAKKSGFNMIVNEGIPSTDPNKKPPRWHPLNEYILSDPLFECSIYGKWTDEVLDSDRRFKGPIHPNSLGTVLETTKYTFCIPIDAGWMTSKFVEMAHFGVIPFLHKDYASKSLSKNFIDDYFFVNSKEDLFNKITDLESSFDKYMAVIEKLKKIIFISNSMAMYTGGFVSASMVNLIHKHEQHTDIWPLKTKESLKETITLKDYMKVSNPMDAFF